ncbi:hypothetical protein, partial [Salmonella enterica]|uniref:hypothetical protein n=1 Tax=Salmonella enterica TaxID=28901 RepID=UPI001C63AED1
MKKADEMSSAFLYSFGAILFSFKAVPFTHFLAHRTAGNTVSRLLLEKTKRRHDLYTDSSIGQNQKKKSNPQK